MRYRHFDVVMIYLRYGSTKNLLTYGFDNWCAILICHVLYLTIKYSFPPLSFAMVFILCLPMLISLNSFPFTRDFEPFNVMEMRYGELRFDPLLNTFYKEFEILPRSPQNPGNTPRSAENRGNTLWYKSIRCTYF